MCYRLFIASDAMLPEISPTQPPSFAVSRVERTGDCADVPFPPEWTVVEAGSTSGCACDFHGKRKASRTLLAEYLRPLCGRQSLRVFSTWYGDEAKPAIPQPAIRWSHVTNSGDPFPLQTLTDILPESADHV